MIIKAILLERKPFREFDEQLLFLSSQGVVSLTSFGSRSPRSNRGKELSKLAWLELELIQSKSNSVLKSIVEQQSIIALDNFKNKDLAFYLEFNHLLKEIVALYPKERVQNTPSIKKPNDSSRPEHSLYQLLQHLSHHSIQALPLLASRLKLLFELSLLQEFGVLGPFQGCHNGLSNLSRSENCFDPFNEKNSELVVTEYFFYQGNYYCQQCIHANPKVSKIFKKTNLVPNLSLKALMLLNFFLKKYQLSHDFFDRFGTFLTSEKVVEKEVTSLLKLTSQVKKWIQ